MLMFTARVRCVVCGAEQGPDPAHQERQLCPACYEQLFTRRRPRHRAPVIPAAARRLGYKTCTACGGVFDRWRYPWGAYENLDHYLGRQFCRATCAGTGRPPVNADARWMERAACRRAADPELFFPDEQSGSPATAKRFCRSCPVRQACLSYALAHDPLLGVWGGLDEDERGRLVDRSWSAA